MYLPLQGKLTTRHSDESLFIRDIVCNTDKLDDLTRELLYQSFSSHSRQQTRAQKAYAEVLLQNTEGPCDDRAVSPLEASPNAVATITAKDITFIASGSLVVTITKQASGYSQAFRDLPFDKRKQVPKSSQDSPILHKESERWFSATHWSEDLQCDTICVKEGFLSLQAAISSAVFENIQCKPESSQNLCEWSLSLFPELEGLWYDSASTQSSVSAISRKSCTAASSIVNPIRLDLLDVVNSLNPNS